MIPAVPKSEYSTPAAGGARNYLLIIFGIYIIVLGTGVWFHEPWMDEAQAWLLVQDTTLSELFVHYLRYEGSPGLWHLILYVPAKLGMPYFTINVISAVISAGGVWLFVFRSPFSLITK